jgi:hypothetical protein
MIANRLAGTYTLLGDGEKVMTFGRWARAPGVWTRRPLLVEGLVDSGRTGRAAAALDQLRAGGSQVSYLQPALAWLEGGLAEQRGAPEEAQRIYQHGEDTASTESPVHTSVRRGLSSGAGEFSGAVANGL